MSPELFYLNLNQEKLKFILPFHCLHRWSLRLFGTEDLPIFAALPRFAFQELELVHEPANKQYELIGCFYFENIKIIFIFMHSNLQLIKSQKSDNVGESMAT